MSSSVISNKQTCTELQCGFSCYTVSIVNRSHYPCAVVLVISGLERNCANCCFCCCSKIITKSLHALQNLCRPLKIFSCVSHRYILLEPQYRFGHLSSLTNYYKYRYDTFGALVQLPVPLEVEFQNCYFLSKLTFFFTITKIYI